MEADLEKSIPTVQLSDLIERTENTEELFSSRPLNAKINLFEIAGQKAAAVFSEFDMIEIVNFYHPFALELCAPYLSGRYLLQFLEIRGGLTNLLSQILAEETREKLLLTVVKESWLSQENVARELRRHMNLHWSTSLSMGQMFGPKKGRDYLRIVDLGLASCANPPLKMLCDPVYTAFVEKFKKRMDQDLPKLPTPLKSHPDFAIKIRKIKCNTFQFPLNPERSDLTGFLNEMDEVLNEKINLRQAADFCFEASKREAHHVVLVYALSALSRFSGTVAHYHRTHSDPCEDIKNYKNELKSFYMDARAVVAIYEQLAYSLGALQADPELTASVLLRMVDFSKKMSLFRLPSFKLRFGLAVQRFFGQTGLYDDERKSFIQLRDELLPLRRSSFLKTAILCRIICLSNEIMENLVFHSAENSLHVNCAKDVACKRILNCMRREIVDTMQLLDRTLLFFRAFDFGDTWFEKFLATFFHANGFLQTLLPLRAKRFHPSQNSQVARICLIHSKNENFFALFEALWFHLDDSSFPFPTVEKLRCFFDNFNAAAMENEGTNFCLADIGFSVLALMNMNMYFDQTVRAVELDPMVYVSERLRSQIFGKLGGPHHTVPLLDLFIEALAFHRSNWKDALMKANDKIFEMKVLFANFGLNLTDNENLTSSSASSSLASPSLDANEEEGNIDLQVQGNLLRAQMFLQESEKEKNELKEKMSTAIKRKEQLEQLLFQKKRFVCPLSSLVDVAGWTAVPEDLNELFEMKHPLLYRYLQEERSERFGGIGRSEQRAKNIAKLRKFSPLKFCLAILENAPVAANVLEGYRILQNFHPNEVLY